MNQNRESVLNDATCSKTVRRMLKKYIEDMGSSSENGRKQDLRLTNKEIGSNISKRVFDMFKKGEFISGSLI